MRKRQPLVSVVIPVFNNEDSVSDALGSVLSQCYSNLEIIVIDDGSTDNSLDCVRNFQNRVKILEQKNAGAAAARNAGMRAARGEYFAFLDADDLWMPDKLTKQIELLEQHLDVDLVCSLWRCWYPLGESQESLEEAYSNSEVCNSANLVLDGWIYHHLLLDCYVWTSTVVLRRSLFERIGEFDYGLRRGQDYDYWLRASRETKIKRLPFALAIYRMREMPYRPPTGKVVDSESMIVDRAVQRWGLSSPDGSAISSAAYRERCIARSLGFAYAASNVGTWRDAVKSAGRALAYNPTSIGVWYRVARTIVGTFKRKLLGTKREDMNEQITVRK